MKTLQRQLTEVQEAEEAARAAAERTLALLESEVNALQVLSRLFSPFLRCRTNIDNTAHRWPHLEAHPAHSRIAPPGAGGDAPGRCCTGPRLV